MQKCVFPEVVLLGNFQKIPNILFALPCELFQNVFWLGLCLKPYLTKNFNQSESSLF